MSASAPPPPGPTILVNGKPRSLGAVASLGDLLRELDVRPQRVVVELNGEIYRRGEGLDQPVGPGAVVEVVHFVGGG